MANKKIYLSPSMQRPNVYAFGDTNEMEQCNRIAEYAEIALKRCGFDVRRAVKGQDMYDSIRESNSFGADLHIPIHTNAYNGKVTGGTLVMLYDSSSENVKAGEALLREISPLSPGSDYALRFNPELAELNSTDAVSVYLEVEFHDTEEGARWIIANVKSIGEGIAKGVCRYFGVSYLAETPKTNYETALLQALLRQAYAQGICKTFVKPIDNRMGKLTRAALSECKETLDFKDKSDSFDLKLVSALEHEINVRRISKENKLREQITEAAGDINGDSKVDIRDVTELQKKIAGIGEE